MKNTLVHHTALGGGSEFDRIRSVWRRLGDLAAPSGDDCAFVDLGGVRLAVSSDLAIEGTHFLGGWLAPEELGWRAAAAGLSDLAAVAAAPVGILASVGISAERPEDELAEIMSGIAAAAGEVGAKVLGGDLVRSDVLVVDVMAIGRLDADPVFRRGARPGDVLMVTGRLGGPGAAVAAWKSGREPDAAARARFAHPVPRVREAEWLRERGVTAMIDVSDGLGPDAGHLASASEVRVVVELDHLPVYDVEVSVEEAAVSGEEYELLITVPSSVASSLGDDFRARFDQSLTPVGRIETGAGISIERSDGSVDDIHGFAHF